jgi:alpha-tubulin suppressor-like RCC1 family protein
MVEVSHADDKVKLKTITSMVSSYSFTFSDNGSVYAAGWNEGGQIGFGDNVSHNVFTEVTDLRDKNIASIIGGTQHSLALGKDSRVYAAERNKDGQIGFGDNVSRNVFTEVTDLRDKNIISIGTGEAFTLALSDNSKVYVTGRNESSQLGLGDNVSHNVFTEVTIP